MTKAKLHIASAIVSRLNINEDNLNERHRALVQGRPKRQGPL